jgi:hypothetical protein
LEPGLDLELGFQFFQRTKTEPELESWFSKNQSQIQDSNQGLTSRTVGFGPGYLDLGLIFRTRTGVVFFPFFEETNPELEPL